MLTSAHDHILLSGRFSDGTPLRIRISHPDRFTFRLQTARDEEEFDWRGAAQTLADLFEGEPQAKERAGGVPLTVVEMERSLLLCPADAVGEGPSLEIGKGPFFVRVNRRRRQLATRVVSVEKRTAEADSAQDKVGDREASAQTVKSETCDWSVTGTLAQEEHIYGTGQRFDSVDRRGKEVHLWAVDNWLETEGNSYVPIPFFISTRGYGVYLNRFESSCLDLGAEKPNRWRFTVQAAPLDLYLFLHPHPAQIIGAYASLTGLAPLPPEWGFGIHVCDHAQLGAFSTPHGIWKMMTKMEENNLPFSSVIIEGWDTYNTDTYDEMKEIVAGLHERGKKVLVYAPCGRFPDPHFLRQGKEASEYQRQHQAQDSYMVHDEQGEVEIEEAFSCNPGDAPYRLRSRFIDLTNPGAVSWWLGTVWRRLVQEIGIDGAKIDYCEQFPEHGGIRFFDGRSSRGMHHLYPVMYNVLMYRYFQEHRPEGGMCHSRGGGIGAQRYPFLWCGDQRREWRYLQAILRALLSSGLSGIPFMTHDLAGYMPSMSPEDNNEKEVFIRGTQLACFSANMEIMGPATRPYDFDDETVAIYRAYSRIHYQLVPYLREQAAISCSTGIPLLRHLFLSCPKDRRVYGIEDQYLLGDDLLVAPVLEARRARPIYFPQGEWRCVLTGETIVGPQTVERWDVPLEDIPVFMRGRPTSILIERIAEEIRDILSEAKTALRHLG